MGKLGKFLTLKSGGVSGIVLQDGKSRFYRFGWEKKFIGKVGEMYASAGRTALKRGPGRLEIMGGVIDQKGDKTGITRESGQFFNINRESTVRTSAMNTDFSVHVVKRHVGLADWGSKTFIGTNGRGGELTKGGQKGLGRQKCEKKCQIKRGQGKGAF